MSAAKRKGTAAESAIVRYLRECGWPHAERRALNGAKDRGDVAGIPGVCVEIKDKQRHEIAAWLDEALVERDNDNAAHGFVWFKRRGTTNPANWFVLMDGATVTALLKEAGY